VRANVVVQKMLRTIRDIVRALLAIIIIIISSSSSSSSELMFTDE